MKRTFFVIGLVAFLAPLALLTRPAHAEAPARKNAVFLCYDANGNIYGQGITCIAVGSTCFPVPCPN